MIGFALFLFLVPVTFFSHYEARKIIVNINASRPLTKIDNKFVGVTIDTGIVEANWSQFDFNSTKLQTLARGLSPSYVRLGGTDADFCIFSNNVIKYHHVNKRDIELSKESTSRDNFTLTETQWDNLHIFLQKVGWDLIFDLNALQRKGKVWDPTNALSLIEYTKKKNYKMAGWELGNEPEMFAHLGMEKVSASQLAQDYQNLSTILKRKPQVVQGHILIGPSTIPFSAKVVKYFTQFFESGGGKAVTNANFHHYYVNGKRASLATFLSPNILDTLKKQLEDANKVARKYTPGKKVWIGETSSAFGGGTAHISNAYAAAFMWLDKLGLAAKSNIGGLMRQAFIQGDYALVDPDTVNPNPDYWLTVLYKRLVGNVVYQVHADNSTNKIRLYAHSANTRWYSPSSVVLFGMNLYKENVTLELPQYIEYTWDLYLLQPPESDLYARTVLLNGNKLHLTSDDFLPNLHIPVKIKEQVTLSPYSYFFLVIPSSD